ncbi:MAG: transporter substrate-binding domain-containing protein, partial [Nitriliruptor sp.]
MRIHLSRTRRLRAVVAPLLATGLLLTACGGGDDDTTSTDDGGSAGEASGIVAEYQESGVTLGVANEVPFGSVGEDGEATGIGPDVARAVLDEMGIAVNDAQVVEFGELIGGLQAGNFDIITAGMYISPER